MKYFAFALLVSSTSAAAVALTAPTSCHDAAVNTAYTAGTADAAKALALATAAFACTTTLAVAPADINLKGFAIEKAIWAPQGVRMVTAGINTSALRK